MMTPALGLESHALSLSFSPFRDGSDQEHLGASTTLLWLDRPFAVACEHTVRDLLGRLEEHPEGGIWIGRQLIEDFAARLILTSERHDLAVIDLDPNELGLLGDRCTFHNPQRWPVAAAMEGESVTVIGFPRDQWPARVNFQFRVESVQDRRFAATLESASMPGRFDGICGGPVFREGPRSEFLGIVTESLFHNEAIRCQHSGWIDATGRLRDARASG